MRSLGGQGLLKLPEPPIGAAATSKLRGVGVVPPVILGQHEPEPAQAIISRTGPKMVDMFVSPQPTTKGACNEKPVSVLPTRRIGVWVAHAEPDAHPTAVVDRLVSEPRYYVATSR